MTDQRPDTGTGPDARRGAVRARRRLARAGTIMAVMALGAGGGVAAAAGASDLLAPVGTIDYTNHSQSSTELHLPQATDAVKTVDGKVGQLGQLQAKTGPQTIPTRDMHNSAAASAANAGRRRAHLRARSMVPASRARTCSPASQRARSSASAWADS